MIWQKNFTLENLNQLCSNSAVSYLGIEISAFGEDWIEATMPVDHRTMQPFGVLHGGVSVALAEGKTAVGLDINANHLRSVRSGKVTARATPINLGRNIQVWQIDIRTEENKLCCVSRLTLSVINL